MGTAPSYFLESLLWNVADDFFRADLPQAYRNVLGWLRANAGDEKRLRERKLMFPNQMAELFGAASDSVWAESAACALISGLRLDLPTPGPTRAQGLAHRLDTQPASAIDLVPGIGDA